MTLDSGEPFRSCANTLTPEIVWDKVMDLLKFPDYSVFQFQTKTLQLFYCPVHLLNNNFIILNLNLFHMEKLILGVKRSAAHNKVTVF